MHFKTKFLIFVLIIISNAACEKSKKQDKEIDSIILDNIADSQNAEELFYTRNKRVVIDTLYDVITGNIIEIQKNAEITIYSRVGIVTSSIGTRVYLEGVIYDYCTQNIVLKIKKYIPNKIYNVKVLHLVGRERKPSKESNFSYSFPN